jgi:signal transduction histidine kinase
VSDSAQRTSRAEIASKLAHEIRGPVSTLRGLAGTALTHYAALSDAERVEFLELIRHEAERLEATVEQVAIAMRLDADAVLAEIAPHDLAGIVRVAAGSVDVGEHVLDLELPERLEAPIDPRHVETIVRQVVRNAATFSPPGSPISVRLAVEGTDAVLTVFDRGPGIPPDRREEVFERFTTWRPVDYETAPGPGLGLFIARSLAEMHGGSISIEDVPEGGTMLAVRFPMEAAGGTLVDDAADL